MFLLALWELCDRQRSNFKLVTFYLSGAKRWHPNFILCFWCNWSNSFYIPLVESFDNTIRAKWVTVGWAQSTEALLGKPFQFMNPQQWQHVPREDHSILNRSVQEAESFLKTQRLVTTKKTHLKDHGDLQLHWTPRACFKDQENACDHFNDKIQYIKLYKHHEPNCVYNSVCIKKTHCRVGL